MGVAAFCLVLMLVEVTRDTVRRNRQQREIEAVERGDLPAGEKLERSQRRSVLRRRLLAAGLPIPPLLFLLMLGLLMAVAGIETWGLFGGAWVPGLVAMIAVAMMILGSVREIGRIRSIKFEEKLVDALDLLVVALRAGENPERALESAAGACEQPIRREFREVVQRLQVGMPVRRALGRMRERYDSEGVRLFTNALAAKWKAGGDLAPVLRKVSRIMRERLRHRLRIQSQMSGARLSAVVVAIAPYIVVLGFYVRHPTWLEALFTHPLGPAALIIAIFLQIVGFLWLNRLARIEF
jgi:tight adherence protein B